ncbi:PREDICTED: WD repeat-containing protein 76 [Propithecus coquereli]|uniref:WD repeat-containing protein 76 n=1 Tax=Propithecus coquereli TaxID=379532 RepID=UPI00063F8AC5|nr:PREDICTED: WD repeat-containing protein 76 [Propithecus coquereli]
MSGSGAAAEKAESRQRLQLKVNEYKENQNIAYVSLRPVQATLLGKTAKVYLVPFSLSNLDQLKYSKSLIEKNSNNKVARKKYKTKIKKTCGRILTPKMKATSSKAESILQKSFLDVHTESDKPQHSNSDTVIPGVDMESSQDGDSDEDTTPGLDDFSGLSPYERKRLKNISENANFFASLQLSESAARLREMIKKRRPPESKRKIALIMLVLWELIANQGAMGGWTQQPKEDAIYVFQPHSQSISCLYFSPANPAHILSLSYDGTLRCGDFSRGIFEEVYRNERSSFSSFDFLAEDASTLIVAHWDGNMSLVDRRTPGTSYEKLINSSLTKIRTIHVHPVHRQYFITAGLRDVHIYDARRLNARGSQPLISLTEHTKSIASAYFSPLTGNRVVTTCADCKLRIFDSSCISSQIPLLTTIRHNTITGRWLTRFQAVWDPKQEDCFMIGSMAYPRRVEIFHETGKRVHSFLGGECLASVCSINAVHPTQYIMAGGNSSGKIHVFMSEKN